ncbi:hypothetical protein LCGC14_3044370, partial [marine sediment metagenome]
AMMLFVRKLDIVDEDDNLVLKIRSKKASVALSEAMAIVKAKEGDKEIKTIWDKLKILDKEFQEYFSME